MNDKLLDILNNLGIVSTFSQQLFLEKANSIELPKNQDLFLEGKKNHFEYVLISGVVYRYNISDKGDTVTTGFYMPKSVITPHFARTNNGKSIFSLQTLTDVVLAEILVTDLDNLRHTNKEFNDFGQRIIKAELARTFYNEAVFRSFNAKERLLTLRKQFPNLENLVPHNIIASYLGITNVSLSRLRNELARKKTILSNDNDRKFFRL
jgi:CRP-like cAMP-binding protein